MDHFRGEALSWEVSAGTIELALHRGPCNEIGSLALDELEKFTQALDSLSRNAHALIIYSTIKAGFCAGADLRELYQRSHEMQKADAVSGVREYLERIHRVLNTIDGCALDLDRRRSWRHFWRRLRTGIGLRPDHCRQDRALCFPELRLGPITGFGGIPRLKRDLGNSVVRDLLLTGLSFNATRAHAVDWSASW